MDTHTLIHKLQTFLDKHEDHDTYIFNACCRNEVTPHGCYPEKVIEIPVSVLIDLVTVVIEMQERLMDVNNRLTVLEEGHGSA